jgi:hypothetical protein
VKGPSISADSFSGGAGWFWKRSGSRVSIPMACRRIKVPLALSLCEIPTPSRTTRFEGRGRGPTGAFGLMVSTHDHRFSKFGTFWVVSWQEAEHLRAGHVCAPEPMLRIECRGERCARP